MIKLRVTQESPDHLHKIEYIGRLKGFPDANFTPDTSDNDCYVGEIELLNDSGIISLSNYLQMPLYVDCEEIELW